jgi:hypothetical protein
MVKTIKLAIFEVTFVEIKIQFWIRSPIRIHPYPDLCGFG